MLFLAPGDLYHVTIGALEELLGRAECVVACGSGEIGGLGAVALLLADYCVLDLSARLVLDASEAAGALTWRTGRELAELRRIDVLNAAEALRLGACDEVTGSQAGMWFAQWMANRSPAALDAAAVLIRTPGGDRREREFFARLFASGEPQRGLQAFLSRR